MCVSYFFVNDTLYALRANVKVCEISSLEKVDSLPENADVVGILIHSLRPAGFKSACPL